jgi:hypothetical protein
MTMTLSEFTADPNNPHAVEGQLPLETNALYKAEDNFNCYLTVTQAMNLAENVLRKARMIQEHGLDDAAVAIWNTGRDNETLKFGLQKARQGGRRSDAA